MREKAGDIVSALLLLAFAATMFGLTLGFPAPGQANDPGTAALPRIVAVGLGVLAGLQLLRPGKWEPMPRGRTVLRLIGIVGLLVVYAIMLETLGFILASTLFLLGAIILAGGRRPLYLVFIPPALSVVLFYVFYVLLGVPLPRGYVEGLLF